MRSFLYFSQVLLLLQFVRPACYLFPERRSHFTLCTFISDANINHRNFVSHFYTFSLSFYTFRCLGRVAGQSARIESGVGARRRQHRDQVRRYGFADAADRVAASRARPGAVGRRGAQSLPRRSFVHQQRSPHSRRQLHLPRPAKQRRRSDAHPSRAQ